MQTATCAGQPPRWALNSSRVISCEPQSASVSLPARELGKCFPWRMVHVDRCSMWGFVFEGTVVGMVLKRSERNPPILGGPARPKADARRHNRRVRDAWLTAQNAESRT